MGAQSPSSLSGFQAFHHDGMGTKMGMPTVSWSTPKGRFRRRLRLWTLSDSKSLRKQGARWACPIVGAVVFALVSRLVLNEPRGDGLGNDRFSLHQSGVESRGIGFALGSRLVRICPHADAVAKSPISLRPAMLALSKARIEPRGGDVPARDRGEEG
jgi:hypothetical protein